MKTTYIYRIKNNNNNKSYIGKSNTPYKRYTEHQGMDGGSILLYNSFKKHGFNSFSFEVLDEVPDENWGYWEKYYIEKYNSMKPNGYNMIEGGSQPPVKQGENHNMAKLNNQKVLEIMELLKETKETFIDIGEKFEISIDQIRRINYGMAWDYFNKTYPIRKNRLNEEDVKLVVELLRNTKITQKEIGIKFGVGRTTITNINNGTNHFIKEEIYPIRKSRNHK